VRLVGPAGEQIGIVAINDALKLAQDADLDLVEVAPTARPPVCKLMDYGKFKYESALKARESRKNQTQTVIKEIKLRPKIDPHDYGTKKGHVERFLKQGDKVKVTIMFRGREQSRPELGYKLLQRLAGDVDDLGFVESAPKQDGRNMIMVIGPHKKKADVRAERVTPRASARATAEREPRPVPAPRPEAVRSEAVRPETPRPETPRPETARPETARPETARPETARPQTPRPEVARPETPRPEVARPETARPQTARPETARPETARPETPRPEVARPETARPQTARPEAPRPAAPRPMAPRTAGPRPTAPRSAAPRPMPPRPTAPSQPPAASGGPARPVS